MPARPIPVSIFRWIGTLLGRGPRADRELGARDLDELVLVERDVSEHEYACAGLRGSQFCRLPGRCHAQRCSARVQRGLHDGPRAMPVAVCLDNSPKLRGIYQRAQRVHIVGDRVEIERHHRAGRHVPFAAHRTAGHGLWCAAATTPGSA